MRTILPVSPGYLLTLIETLRARLRAADFQARQRVRPADFTRTCTLTFPVLMLFVLQKSVKLLQRHLHEFFDDLAAGIVWDPLTSGAVTHARAKLKASAFSELNQTCVLPVIYGPKHPIQRWRGHRLVGVDSSLVRLPKHEELGNKFGWKEATNPIQIHGDEPGGHDAQRERHQPVSRLHLSQRWRHAGREDE